MIEHVYDGAFFAQLTKGSLASARAVIPLLFRYHLPKSVVDVGCGLGTWLKGAMELGVTDVLGIDGDYVDAGALLIPKANYRAMDLREHVAADRRFDLAISLEVAEHLPVSRSETFVKDLVDLSDVILFSAALPYQGGTNHINEQWLEFWAILFQRHGYVPCDLLRHEIWGEPNVEFWYSQNLMVFCTPEHAAKTFPANSMVSGHPLSHPHPLTFLVNAARYRPLAATALQRECEDYTRLFEAYQQCDGTLPLLAVPNATDEAGEPLFPRSRTLIASVNEEASIHDAEIKRLTGELKALRCAAAQSVELLAARDLEVARTTGELEAARGVANQLAGRTASLEVEVGRLTAEVKQSKSALSGRESEIDSLKNELCVRNDELRRLSTTLDAQACEMQKRSQEMAVLWGSLQEATTVAATRENDLAAFRNSLTWRLTQPLRRCAGWLETIRGLGDQATRIVASSGLFDREYYLAQNPDVAASGIDPIRHYLKSGASEGRNPSRHFDTLAYIEQHPELSTSGMNPLLHHLLHRDPGGAAPPQRPVDHV